MAEFARYQRSTCRAARALVVTSAAARHCHVLLSIHQKDLAGLGPLGHVELWRRTGRRRTGAPWELRPHLLGVMVSVIVSVVGLLSQEPQNPLRLRWRPRSGSRPLLEITLLAQLWERRQPSIHSRQPLRRQPSIHSRHPSTHSRQPSVQARLRCNLHPHRARLRLASRHGHIVLPIDVEQLACSGALGHTELRR